MLRARLTLVASAALVGCSLPGQRADFASRDPAERTLAVARAAETTDPESLPALIRLLESDDPAERMLALRALEKRTGQTLGYDHCDSEPRRAEAVRRWVAWQRATNPGAAPTSSGSTGR